MSKHFVLVTPHARDHAKLLKVVLLKFHLVVLSCVLSQRKQTYLLTISELSVQIYRLTAFVAVSLGRGESI